MLAAACEPPARFGPAREPRDEPAPTSGRSPAHGSGPDLPGATVVSEPRLRRLNAKGGGIVTSSRPSGSPAVIDGLRSATETATRTVENYIGGRWVASDATRFGEVRNPATDELLARVPLGAESDVDRAVQAAARAFPAWRGTPPVQRVKALWKLKNLMEERF